MANNPDKNKPYNTNRPLFGRTVIKLSAEKVDSENLLTLLSKAIGIHQTNQSDIDYLWNYYKGKQDVLHRVKQIRPDICNKIVVNRAHEIVSFNVGYLCGEPIQYVSRVSDEDIVKDINTLNELMFSEDKASKDQEIIEWQMICGTAYRLVLPDNDDETADAPFEIYTLDPRNTFVVYSADIGNKPLFACTYYQDTEKNVTHYSIYTEDMFYKVEDSMIVRSEPNSWGTIPIFEYPANAARLGSFEIVLPLLNAINDVQSNRLDGVEQQVQSFLKFINCEVDKEKIEMLNEYGAIMIKSVDGLQATVDVVKTDLDQNQTQTLIDDLYSQVLTICGIPNRNGGKSTSDTGAAVLLRDGWSLAEARAKDSEHIFKKSEKQMLKLVLKMCRELTDVDINVKDISLKFTRRNFENIQSKSQVLISMLQSEKIHPLLAFESSGMFSDAEGAYSMSKKYYEDQLAKWSPIEVDENEELVPEN